MIEDARDRLCHDPRSMPLSLRAPVSLACKELLPILEPMVNRDSNEINQMHVYMSLYSTFMKAARLWSARRITNQWQETGYASWSHTVYKVSRPPHTNLFRLEARRCLTRLHAYAYAAALAARAVPRTHAGRSHCLPCLARRSSCRPPRCLRRGM